MRTGNTHGGQIFFNFLRPQTRFFYYIMTMICPYFDPEFAENLHFFKLPFPEVDTIRFAIPSGSMFNVDKFIQCEFSKRIANFQKMVDDNGRPILDNNGKEIIFPTWTKERLDGRNSWYGKMQVYQGKIGSDFDKNAPIALIVEYSVAKWHNVTNGVNRGVRASFDDCFDPVFEVLESKNAIKYTPFRKMQTFKTWIKNNFVLRRLDLSYNFKVPHVNVVMRKLATCRLNNVDADAKKGTLNLDEVQDAFTAVKKHRYKMQIEEFEDRLNDLKAKLADAAAKYETVSFGGGRGSMYKAMFYDKDAEQKKYYSNFANACVDPYTKTSDLANRKEFYRKNKHFFEKIVRFEVQYNSKFFIEKVGNSYKREKGLKMFENLVYICENHWAQTLKKFDEQLGVNVEEHLDRYESLEKVMNHLDTLAEVGTITKTVANNLKGFIQDCWKFPGGWEGVRNHIGKSLFSHKYTQLKKLTNFDVKRECLRDLPIMRNMETMGLYSGNYWLNRAEKAIYFDYGNYMKFA